jgi:hypothetical protein
MPAAKENPPAILNGTVPLNTNGNSTTINDRLRELREPEQPPPMPKLGDFWRAAKGIFGANMKAAADAAAKKEPAGKAATKKPDGLSLE